MDRITLLLHTQDLVYEACSKGNLFLLNLSPKLIPLCVKTMLNVIDMYDLDTPEGVIDAMNRRMSSAVQLGKMSNRDEALMTALYRAIADAPDDAEIFAGFTLYWMSFKARNW